MGYASEACTPAHCTRCGAVIECGFQCIDVNSGYGRIKRKLICGQGSGLHACTSGMGRVLTYYCSRACGRRHRRARNRVKEVVCSVCDHLFPTTRRDARYCSNACRQEAYRER
jgi:hypothetical protein